jgi:hypothetical protein
MGESSNQGLVGSVLATEGGVSGVLSMKKWWKKEEEGGSEAEAEDK